MFKEFFKWKEEAITKRKLQMEKISQVKTNI